MSENKIRRYNATRGILPHGGPNSAGIGFDDTKNLLAISTSTSTSSVMYHDNEKYLDVYVSTTVTTSNVHIFPKAAEVTGIYYVNEALSTDTSLSLRKATSTTAPGSGTLLHATPMYGTTAINTVTTVTLTSSGATLTFAAGDRLGLSGVTSASADTLIVVKYKSV